MEKLNTEDLLAQIAELEDMLEQERRQLNTALQKVDTYERIFLSMQSMIFLVDRDLKYIDYFIPQKIPFFAKSELIGTYLGDFLPSYTMAVVRNAIDTLSILSKTSEFEFEEEGRVYEGQLSMLEENKYLIILNDITHKISEEQKLFATIGRLQLLTEASTEAILIHDGHNFITCNRQFGRMMGYSISEIRGKSIYDLIDPESAERVRRIIQSDYTEEYVIDVVRKDGSVIPAKIRPSISEYQGNKVRIVRLDCIEE